MSDVGGEFAENCGFEGKILCEVPQGARGCDSRDTCDTPATGYTPPEGWRVLAVGEILQAGDMWVNHEGESRPTKRVGERVNDELYIRCDPIEPQPKPEPQPPMPQDADQMIRLLSEANHNHVAMIGRLQGRINDLETIRDNQAATIETLQPIAAACHTAQTMVRDMLGHMRCLLALHHTTDRRDSCTLLESILEVFDDAECDEDEDDTSEAGQG